MNNTKPDRSMKPEEALNLLDSAIAQQQLSRQAHVAVQAAVAILSKLIKDSKEEVEE